MTAKQFDSSPPTTSIDEVSSKKKRAHASVVAPRQQQAAQHRRRRRLFVDHDPQTTMYEQWCCDVVTDRPIVLRSSFSREPDDAILTQCSAPPSFVSSRIVFFLERCDHNNSVAWRQMLTFARRLRSLTADVFPLLHERLAAVYWCRPRTAATRARAFNKHGALFFNAAAIDASDMFHCFQVVCHELAHSVEESHNGRFVAAVDECERAHFPAFWGFYVNHLFDGDSEGDGGSGGGSSGSGDNVVDLTL